MDLYLPIKTIHIVSSTVLFGTGLGIAFFFLMGRRSGDPVMALFAARTTCLADMLFTLTAGIVQPLSGFALIWLTGFDPFAPWLVWTYALYLLALACWLPVVWLQLRMRDMAMRAAAEDSALPELYHRYGRIWFRLGIPAFSALVVVFYLMVFRPAG